MPNPVLDEANAVARDEMMKVSSAVQNILFPFRRSNMFFKLTDRCTHCESSCHRIQIMWTDGITERQMRDGIRVAIPDMYSDRFRFHRRFTKSVLDDFLRQVSGESFSRNEVIQSSEGDAENSVFVLRNDVYSDILTSRLRNLIANWSPELVEEEDGQEVSETEPLPF